MRGFEDVGAFGSLAPPRKQAKNIPVLPMSTKWGGRVHHNRMHNKKVPWPHAPKWNGKSPILCQSSHFVAKSRPHTLFESWRGGKDELRTPRFSILVRPKKSQAPTAQLEHKVGRFGLKRGHFGLIAGLIL